MLRKRGAGHHSDSLVLEGSHSGRQPAGAGQAVGVSERDDLATRDLGPHVPHPTDPTIDQLNPDRDRASLSALPTSLSRAVRGAVVEHEDVVVRIVLPQQGVETTEHALPPVLDRNRDCDMHWHAAKIDQARRASVWCAHVWHDCRECALDSPSSSAAVRSDRRTKTTSTRARTSFPRKSDRPWNQATRKS